MNLSYSFHGRFSPYGKVNGQSWVRLKHRRVLCGSVQHYQIFITGSNRCWPDQHAEFVLDLLSFRYCFWRFDWGASSWWCHELAWRMDTHAKFLLLLSDGSSWNHVLIWTVIFLRNRELQIKFQICTTVWDYRGIIKWNVSNLSWNIKWFRLLHDFLYIYQLLLFPFILL